MRIIPAIDIIEGKAVRLEKGDFTKKKVYAENPVEVAKSFYNAGIKYLHLVDLDGAKAQKVVNQDILEQIKKETDLIVDYGGGVRSENDMRTLFNAGADQVNIGSLSIKDPDKVRAFIRLFGAERIVLSPDIKGKNIAVHGWQETSDVLIADYIRDYMKDGIAYFVCTDIEKDGMLTGSSVELYKDLMSNFPEMKLLASGGVASVEELEDLKEANVDGVIIGKAIYEGKISLNQIEKYVV